MKVAFAGTPVFAAQALEAILAAGFEVPLVLTQPDRPAGRGQKLQPSPVKQVALAKGLNIHQPEKLRDPSTHAPLHACGADVMVVAAYGLILPQAVLDIPPMGCLNIHASLLPRWRGAAPIQRAIEAGDTESGITIMIMEAGLDTGPMLSKEALPITATDNAARLHDKLAALGARMIVETLRKLPERAPTPQNAAEATYAHKIEKAEARMDWHLPAEVLWRRIRAFAPFPGTLAMHGETPIKLWAAECSPAGGMPGEVLSATAEGIVVACGTGALCLTELQKPGGKRLSAGDFLHGFPLAAGDRFQA